MIDLASEYKIRHNLPLSVSVLTEGLLFFRLGDSVGPILLLSSPSKSYQLCEHCHLAGGSIVLEFLLFDSYNRPLSIVSHRHFGSTDFDILEEAKSFFGSDLQPVAIPSARRLEEYVWLQFIRLCSLHSKFSGAVKGIAKSFDSARATDWMNDATRFATKHPMHFQQFYNNVYAPLLINRKYLVTRN